MASASITIPNVDGETLSRFEAESQRRGMAVSELARELLREGVARPTTISTSPPTDNLSGPYHDLDFLIGTWTDVDLAEFEAATAEFRQIDPDIWK